VHLEILALRHQLAAIPSLTVSVDSRRPDAVAWLSRAWRVWRSPVRVVKRDTVIAWHRRGFGLFWT
jgi:hypothetical protein